MTLFIATGSNIGDRKKSLDDAKSFLTQKFELIAESRIYHSKAVDYLEQDDFYNQVLEFKSPSISPDQIMEFLLNLELQLGRKRQVVAGPRTIDLDILFIDDLKIQTNLVNIPHPRAFERSFVILPLAELPGFDQLKKSFQFKFEFTNSATPILN